MLGSLDLRGGVLYVGTEEKTAHVRAFDLDGRLLEAGFSFRGPDGAAASVDGLAVDDDHRVWVADAVGGRLIAFTIFGAEVGRVDRATHGAHDGPGFLASPVDVISVGCDAEQQLVVASKGRRRHAVQVLPLGSGSSTSLRPRGRPDGRFHGVRGIASRERWLWVCEGSAGRVQVFRDEEFHFAFEVPLAGGARFEPNALVSLPDGRLLVAQGGPASSLLLLDRSGRFLRTLAGTGRETGEVHEPGDLALEEGEDDRRSRLAVIDRDGTRVQIFNLLGDCYGTFPDFPGSEGVWS